MAKKKNQKKQKSAGEVLGFKDIFSNEKTDFILGLLMLALTVYTAIAMVSYLNTGAADQSILENMKTGEWLNPNHQFANYCKSFGAIIAYFLITQNFGLPAFAIPLFTLLVGLRLMGIYKVNLWKWFFGLVVIMVWASVALAKFLTPFMGAAHYNPGGAHGLFCVEKIEQVVGEPGLAAILIVTAIIFMVFVSNETIKFFQKALNPVKYLTNKIKFTVINTSQSPEDKTEEEEYDSDPEDQEPSTTIDLTDFGNIDEPKAVDVISEEPDKKEEKKKGDISVDVEVGKEEEKAKGKTVEEEIDLSTPINPKEPFTRYKYPTLNLLKRYDNDGRPTVDMEEIKTNNANIVKVLNSFGVAISEIKATVGPTITLYELTPAPGVRIAKIKNLEDDIALSLAALGVRIIAPIPGKGTIGIEVPNKKPNIVSMESILNSKKFQDTKMDLPIALGKTITNEVYMADLAKIPHLLVAGATGQGKSVGLNAIITSLLYKKHPNEMKIVLIDPKKVEFSIYLPIAKHFMACLPENEEEPIITDVTKVVRTLNSLCALMDTRYDLLKLAGARNIKEYNDKYVNHKLRRTDGHEFMPYIVVVIDEFGDLIMTAGKEIEKPICRIAQLARAVGIHMVIATQRPTTNIITGTIKANFPGRMAFKVSAMIDSRTILDKPGANQLIGRGDMLFLNGSDPVRVQCAFVDTPEVERINEYIEKQPGPVEPLELPEPAVESNDGGGSVSGDIGGSIDPLFEEAAHAIISTQQGSTSMIQRRFSIGYNRAGRLMDQLEKAGIVGPAMGSKPRDVLVSDINQLGNIISQLK
ncbi:MAG: DNA translocase FtsK 4TM domain-containing protein [Prevotella sp.]|nr:DNA translocase FtsK 4TM domain-containing protein [Prevotella sp.]